MGVPHIHSERAQVVGDAPAGAREARRGEGSVRGAGHSACPSAHRQNAEQALFPWSISPAPPAHGNALAHGEKLRLPSRGRREVPAVGALGTPTRGLSKRWVSARASCRLSRAGKRGCQGGASPAVAPLHREHRGSSEGTGWCGPCQEKDLQWHSLALSDVRRGVHALSLQ